MCGINLIIDKHSLLDDSAIRKMNAAIVHRGPDASGFKIFTKGERKIFLGANRLKIQDTSDAANQPFLSGDAKQALVYNGEIYNHRELRVSLEKKFEFRTASDTETLLCFLQEGNDPDQLNGMFAFAFYNSEDDKLTLARDARGIKPLYYYEDEKYFIASSEIRGIFASGLVEKRLNDAQLGHYLRYKYVKKPGTIYKNIQEMEEGGLISVIGTETKISSWTRKRNTEEFISCSGEELEGKVQDLLFAAVERHLLSDAPAGIFLSGGVDSTLLLAIIQELGVKDFPSFSIVNSEKDRAFGTDDFYYAALAAKKYNSVLYKEEVNASVLRQFDAFIAATDQPIGDSAALLTWRLSQYASSQVKVILSGAGADEYFAGYNRHAAFYWYLKNLKGKNFLISLLNKAGKFLPEGRPHPWRKESRLLNKFLAQLDKDPAKTFDNFCSLSVEGLLLHTENDGSEVRWEKGTDSEYFSLALHSDKNNYLISDVLALTDKMSMQSSLEIRVPYLDKALTEFLDSVDPALLLKHGGKWPLKKILNSLGGEVFTNRKKEGFGMPVGQWLKEKEGAALRELLQDRTNPMYEKLSYEKVIRLLNMHLQNKKDLSSELWSLVTLAGFIRKEF